MSSRKLLFIAGLLGMAGVLLFSGSLYALALGAPHALWPRTPAGGLLLVAGWALVISLGWRPPPAAAWPSG